jgi:hypothetical protein
MPLSPLSLALSTTASRGSTPPLADHFGAPSALFPLDDEQGLAITPLSPLSIHFDHFQEEEEPRPKSQSSIASSSAAKVNPYINGLKPKLTIRIPTPPLRLRRQCSKEENHLWVRDNVPTHQLTLEQAWAGTPASDGSVAKAAQILKEMQDKGKIKQEDEELTDKHIEARLAAAEAAFEGAQRTEAAAQTAIWSAAKKMAHQAATAAASRFYDQSTVSHATERLKHLINTRWTHAANPIDSWELQSSTDSNGWTHLNPSSFADRVESPYLGPSTPSTTITTPPPSPMSVSETSSAEEYREARRLDNQYTQARVPTHWPEPSYTPLHGTNHTPPRLVGDHPGEGWERNDTKAHDYYAFTIMHPLVGTFVIAPWIRYNMDRKEPTVSATFGRHYPVHTRLLRPLPVNYPTHTISAQEAHIFRTELDLAPAVDFILQECCAYDLVAGVNQYRHYLSLIKSCERTIKCMIERREQHQSKLQEVLSDLENADAFNRIICRIDIAEELSTEDPESHEAFGPLKEYALSLHPHDAETHKAQCASRPYPVPPTRTMPKSTPCDHKSSVPSTSTTSDHSGAPAVSSLRRRTAKRLTKCFKCKKWGHIKRNCPQNPRYTIWYRK